MSEVRIYNSLISMLYSGKWDEFDAKFAEVVLPIPWRDELLELKAQAIAAARMDQGRGRIFDELNSLIHERRWDDFDLRVTEVTLSPQRLDELFKLKAQGLDAEQKEEEERRHQAIVDDLTFTLRARNWDEFDRKFASATLPPSRLEELLNLKSQEIAAEQQEQEDRRRQTAIDELELLLHNRRWREFDFKLAEARLLETEREEQLGRKALALIPLIPDQIRPDPDQARIIASPAKTLRVTARAGSGKTRLLTALTCFLVKECGYAPEEILLLAFNNSAAGQLEERLTKLLQIPSFPTARTFHSLAYGISQPEQDLLFDRGEDVATRQLTMLVQEILRGFLDTKLLDDVYELFRRETNDARATGAFLTGEAAYDFRRSLTHFTLGGLAVKSRGEKFIGDFLFEHGLTHYYENPAPTRWQGLVYRPDFKIMTGEKSFVIWEHWAVDPDADCVSESKEWPEKKLREYQETSRRKREYWSAKKIPLIESCADACSDREAFEMQIAEKLCPDFPNLRRLPKSELIEKLVAVHLSTLAGWLGQAIQRAQKRGLDSSKLSRALDEHAAGTERERLFLALLEKVFTAYEPRLVNDRKTDFDRLFNGALTLLRAAPPHTLMGCKEAVIDLRQVRYCLVDEAQDLSPQFIEAVACLRDLNPKIKIVFVGDDWQAINRFAGSDVELFTAVITTRFGRCATPSLATNYRSARKVVRAGNRLMQGQGELAVPYKEDKGTIQLAHLDKIWVEWREAEPGWSKDKPFRECGNGVDPAFFKALYQLAIPDLVAGKTVGVLFRTNKRGGKLPDLEKTFVRLLRLMGWPKEQVDVWQKEKIRFSTAHRFKGAERHTIFVVDPYAGKFPLLNADSIELFRFFGDSLEQAEADERRLFYVAITRAEERLVFLTEARYEESSPYLDAFRDLIEEIQIPNDPIFPPAPNAPSSL